MRPLALLMLFAASTLLAQTPQNVWPAAPPFPVTTTGPEADTTTPDASLIAGRRVIRLGNVATATYTVYPPKGTNTGAAVVVFPGGAYSILALDLEGTEVCDWLTTRGVTCVLLKYRVPGSGPWPQQKAALADAQRTVGLIRANAAALGADPHRVGVLGFSAGAHLAIVLSQAGPARLYPRVDAADDQPCLPDFTLLIYPAYVVLGPDLHPNPDIHPGSTFPPTFLVQAENDDVHVENAVVYARELKDAGVPVELHIYAKGGHGFGLRPTANPITRWPALAEVWLKTIGVVR